MTENKRFSIKRGNLEFGGYYYDIVDNMPPNRYQKVLATFHNHKEFAEILCDLLNDLSEENEQLKEKIDKLEGMLINNGLM